MIDDRQLLQQYVEDGSEAAFGELVARHINLVYSVASREVGPHTHLAQDVAQLVFLDLARKARWLGRGVVLAGWLHRATRYAARQTLRTERRRQAREQEAITMTPEHSDCDSDWEQIRPALDEALDRLTRSDRDALLLRYFSQRSLADVGAALGSTEEAARKRVTRALSKLRALLARRGVTTSAGALSAVLSAHAVQAAPAGLAATLTTASIASTASVSGTALTFLKLMTMTKLKAGLVGAIVVASVATPIVLQYQSAARMRDENNALRSQLAELQNASPSHAVVAPSTTNQSLDDERHRELLRLRGEVNQLRRQTNELEKLRGENETLRASVATPPKSPATNPNAQRGMDFPREAWAFAGYAQPTSAFQSFVWAGSSGDVAAALASFTPEMRVKREAELASKTDAEIAAQMIRDTQHTKRFRVLGEQAVSADEVHLQLYVEGERTPDTILERTARMRRIDNEWKFDGWVKKPRNEVVSQ